MSRVTGRALKNLTLLAGIVLSGLVLLAWTGQWFELTLDGKSSAHSVLDISGQVAAPALIALALANLALVGALAIAGPVIRAVLGVVAVFLGFTVGLSAIVALANPAVASESSIIAATGVSGRVSIQALVTAVSVSGWPWFAAVVGALVMAFGVFVVVTGRRWPGSSRRYQAARLESATGGDRGTDRTPVTDWDSLSSGDDPTSR